MFIRHLKKLTAAFALTALAFSLFFGTVCFSAAAATPRAAELPTAGMTLRVPFTITKGISEYDENGNRTGILVDYLNEISKYTDWRYEYIDVSAEFLTTNFLKGDYDLMGGTYYNADWEKYFAYPDYPMGNSHTTLLFRKDDADIKSYDIRSINGKTIGVYENATEKIRRLEIYLASNNLDCKLKYYTREQMNAVGNLYGFLRDGEVDVLLGNDTDVTDDFALFATYKDQLYYFVTQPSAKNILSDLNYAMERIYEINPDFAEDTYEKNVGDVSGAYVRLSDEERAYVRAKGKVRVSIIRNWHPFFCAEDNTVSHKGILPDTLNEVGKFSGLEFEYVFADTYTEMIASVQQGRADVLGCFDDGDEAAFGYGLAKTESYTTLNNTIVKNKSVNFPGNDLVGGIVRGRTLDSGLTSREPVYFDNAKAGIEAVNRGEIDFFSGLSSVIEHEFQIGKYSNVMFVSSANTSMEISFALKRPVDTLLYSVINKSLRSITAAEKANITNQNIVSEGVTYSPTLADIIAAYPAVFVLIICAIFAIVSGVCIVFVRFRYRSKVMAADLEKAEARSRAKSDFLSRMSHEIRTPMNAIVGLTDLVAAEPGLSLAAQDKIDKIRSSSDYLLSLINDILDMSRIENDKLTLAPECFSLGDTLDEIDKLTDVLATRKGVLYETSRSFEHDAVTADPVRLRQVIVNLISNAVKFTPAGKKIYCTIKEVAADENSATFEFAVADEGVGISAEDKERVFKAFEQAGTNMTRSEGTGLGLAISSSIVQLMGGSLSVESEPGCGSRFSFTVRLPLGDRVTARQEQADKDCLRGVRVLLAEDNDINAEIAAELLAMYGAATDRAENGREAMDMFAASAAGYYDVILMDLKMPVMDGLAATREIRACGRADASAVPIVAMTANSFVEDRRAAEEAGMNGFVPKPVNMEQLVATVRDLAAKARDDRA